MSALMGQPKPLASLSSALLARKGQAKPAMRPQGFSGFGAVTEAIDDLGWNDMGSAEAQPMPAPVAPMPPVLRQREVLREELETPVAPKEVTPVAAIAPPAPAPALRKAAKPRIAAATGTGKAKAAFTLRLDAERHLRLRLASALSNRSSQQLVTEALDIFLQSLPEVEAMAVRLSSRADAELGDGG